ncbi:hypothetical protein [Salmonella enterica]|uniref:hypothetical protein n=1 Tax=Salmonella enterica TaxID=28901 RepID=UPI00160255F1|nr:hypothetical protein [Salmonella enterica]
MIRFKYVVTFALFVPGVYAADFPTNLYTESENKFISVIDKYAQSVDGVDNELKINKLKKERDKEIYPIFKNENNNFPQNWYGVVDYISTTNDGDGVIKIKIADNITIGTWNTSFADKKYYTLIKADSKLYDVVSDLSEGDIVKFSGLFHSASKAKYKPTKTEIMNEKGFYESSLTLKGGMTEPSYIFSFTDIEKIN